MGLPIPAVRDVHAIGLATFDDLGVAADHGDAGAFERVDMARTSASRTELGEAFFEDEGDDHGMGSGAGDGEIVDGSVDGEFADGAAGKTQGLDDEAVGGEGDGGCRRFRRRRRRPSRLGRAAERRSGANRPSTSLRLALPPAPWDISICGSRKRSLGRSSRLEVLLAQATALIVVTSDFRCS